MLGKLTMENFLLKKEKEFIAAAKKEIFYPLSGPNSNHLRRLQDSWGCQEARITTSQKIRTKEKNVIKISAPKYGPFARRFPFYGYRRITHALRRKGVVVNHKKVLKLMRDMKIQVKRRRKFTSTTNSNHNLKVYPNLIKNMVVDRIDKLWCADITYIYLQSGFVYLAAIIDAFSRKVVGYCLGAGHWQQRLP